MGFGEAPRHSFALQSDGGWSRLSDLAAYRVIAEQKMATSQSYLARDYFFKYPFKTEDLLSHMPSFCVMFFLDDPPLAPASRFRLSMRLYDSIRQNVENNVSDDVATRALRIKTDRDFLDTDIVQDITFGFPYEGIRHRVVALTFDDAEIVGARAMWHKQVGSTLAGKMQTLAASDPQVASDISHFLTHPGGCVVQSDKDGNVIRFIDLSAALA